MPLWAGPSTTVRVPAGTIRPFLDGKNAEPVQIQAFLMDRYPVTNAQFADFVAANPEWGPGRKPDLFADENYLQHWVEAKERRNSLPVTNVSFFAAEAYCESQGMRLATTYEWEYAAAFPSAESPRESSRDFAARILSWYAKTGNELRVVGTGYRNVLGIYDLHGLIWEWTEDFNSATVGGDSRDAGESGLFCGAAATAASDPSQYANFMRYAFRSGLQARSTSKNLGFRCVRDI
tara:strand:- start:359470 stop:360174 length:705 start_codon:yes stop_codon:yes gene_type:complete